MRFSAAESSVFGTFAIGLVVVCVFEAPIVHIAAHHAPPWVRLVIAAANVWTIVWLLQERRRMRDAGYTVGDAGLDVAIGTRVRGVLRVTPIDAPNVELVGRAPLTLATSFGLRRSASRAQLYVDDPEGFVDAVRSRLSPAP
jgi:hypothetical protein